MNPRFPPKPSSCKGHLLVASPPLADPNFDRTVVYVIEHGDDGAVGVVVNRPLPETLPEPVERWNDELSAPGLVFEGGPVETEALIALAEVHGESEAWTLVDDTLASLDLSLDPATAAAGVLRLRVFRGYSGWAPGQLDEELDQDAWIVLPATLDDVFTAGPGELWRSVLQRQGGRLAWLAKAPDDLSAN
ncbi:MAG: YqgE/AlgH family protein [Actinomycetota bacterium]